MGRRLNRNDSAVQFEKYYRGCIWGLLPLQFQSFKKLMPQTRHKPARHSKYGQNQKPSKEFEEGCGRMKGQVPERPRLQRTYSIHHLEPSSRYLDGLKLDPKHPVVSNKISNASEPEMCVDLSDLSEQDEDEYPLSCKSSSSGETYEDFFEAFKIDRKLFLENTQKMDAEDLKFLKSNRVAWLRRSGSFPVVNKPGGRHEGLTPIKLENKITEVWPWPWPSSSSMSSSSSTSSSSSSSSFHRSVNMLARSRSTDCKLLVDAFEDLSTAEKSSDYASVVRRYKLSRIRRASSLNSESLERYAQLFETSFGRDMKLISSKSLKLPNQDEAGFNQSEFKSLKKTHSLQEARLIERSDSVEFSKARYESATLRSDDEQSDSEVGEDEAAATDHTMSDVSAAGNVIDSTRNEHDEVAAAADRISYPEPEHVKDHAENESCASRPSFKISGQSEAETHVDPNSESQQNAARLNPNDSLQAEDSSGDSTNLQTALNQLGVDFLLKLKTDTDHQLLSDLVNEALFGLYGGSDAYWPASLCSNCHMHRLPPSEHHVFKKVKSNIQKLESFSLKASNTMDSLIAFDLAGDQAWISLQADAESLGLALDEMIFDELMDELIYE